MSDYNENNPPQSEARGGRGRLKAGRGAMGGRNGRGRIGEGRGGEGRRRKLFDGSELSIMILSLIHDADRHGYDVIRAFDEASGSAYVPSPGVIYPQLSMLADEGLIEESPSEGAKKSYRLTTEGAVRIAAGKVDAALLFERLSALKQQRRHFDSGPARRAVHNLRSALAARLSHDGVDEETLFKAVALIDETTQKIERL